MNFLNLLVLLVALVLAVFLVTTEVSEAAEVDLKAKLMERMKSLDITCYDNSRGQHCCYNSLTQKTTCT